MLGSRSGFEIACDRVASLIVCVCGWWLNASHTQMRLTLMSCQPFFYMEIR